MPGQEMTCDHCRKSTPVTDIKYMPRGKGGMAALCSACRNKKGIVVDKKFQPPEPKSDKKEYFCTRCKYKFKYNPKSGTALRCPFCGKEDKVMENKVPDADTLIRTLHDE